MDDMQECPTCNNWVYILDTLEDQCLSCYKGLETEEEPEIKPTTWTIEAMRVVKLETETNDAHWKVREWISNRLEKEESRCVFCGAYPEDCYCNYSL